MLPRVSIQAAAQPGKETLERLAVQIGQFSDPVLSRVGNSLTSEPIISSALCQIPKHATNTPLLRRVPTRRPFEPFPHDFDQ